MQSVEMRRGMRARAQLIFTASESDFLWRKSWDHLEDAAFGQQFSEEAVAPNGRINFHKGTSFIT